MNRLIKLFIAGLVWFVPPLVLWHGYGSSDGANAWFTFGFAPAIFVLVYLEVTE